MYTDKIIKCKECGEDFVFTAGEQQFYADKGFDSEPSRCRRCRNRGKSVSGDEHKKVMYEIVCSKCGKVESIPFEPRHDRPVYCNECYRKLEREKH